MASPATHTTTPDTRFHSSGWLTRDQVLTVSEVAELLHMPVSTVYYPARRGVIPACRRGRT
jgi:excisionase family DNA binding protein